MSYDITTTVGKIRLLIGDTDIANEVFTDAEITYFYDTAGSINLGAAMAAEAWAAKYMTSADAEKIGDYSYSKKIVDKMLNLAKRLRENDLMEPTGAAAEIAHTDFTARDIVYNRSLREG